MNLLILVFVFNHVCCIFLVSFSFLVVYYRSFLNWTRFAFKNTTENSAKSGPSWGLSLSVARDERKLSAADTINRFNRIRQLKHWQLLQSDEHVRNTPPTLCEKIPRHI